MSSLRTKDELSWSSACLQKDRWHVTSSIAAVFFTLAWKHFWALGGILYTSRGRTCFFFACFYITWDIARSWWRATLRAKTYCFVVSHLFRNGILSGTHFSRAGRSKQNGGDSQSSVPSTTSGFEMASGDSGEVACAQWSQLPLQCKFLFLLVSFINLTEIVHIILLDVTTRIIFHTKQELAFLQLLTLFFPFSKGLISCCDCCFCVWPPF